MRIIKIKEVLVPALLVATGVASMSVGCTRQVYVPVERVHTDTVLIAKTKTDTVLGRDSVYLAVKGDTVVKEVYKWRFRSRLRVDTVYRTHVDTVTLTVRVPESQASAKPAKSFLSTLSEVLKWFTRAAMLALVGYVLVRFFRFFRSQR